MSIYEKILDHDPDYSEIELGSKPPEETVSSRDKEISISASRVFADFSTIVFSQENLPRIAGATLLTTASIGCNFLAPALLGHIVQGLSAKELSEEELTTYIVALVACYAFGQGASRARDLIMQPVIANNVKKLIFTCVEHVLNKSLQYHSKMAFGDILYFVQKGFSVTAIAISLLDGFVPILVELGVASIFLSQKYDGMVGFSMVVLLMAYVLYCKKTAQSILDSREKSLVTGNAVFENFSQSIKSYKVMHDCGQLKRTLQGLDKALEEGVRADIHAGSRPQEIALGQSLISHFHPFDGKETIILQGWEELPLLYSCL
ncbi:MAG: hypothetical protein A3F67_02955 [Verrucomicrobia bacterium RIFCSPHIGHO2_12_FULL_41_10]|nr:MAG: hypothetical protein A3F67_02955 [Verrucomicrobia bacterium RIFCSPHIGHO2_12_FULL_41_10]